jgi:Uma2 family endonuclease
VSLVSITADREADRVAEMAAPRRLLTRTEYEALVLAGHFEDERVELIEGEIWEMSPIGPDHAESVDRLNELLVTRFAGRARVRVQAPMAIGDRSEPQPDLLLVERRSHAAAHPRAAHLAIEVAKSSLRRDRGVKAELYAAAGVPEYWVVNLVDRVVEVRSHIVSGAYARIETHRSGATITLLAFPDVSIAVDDVLP